MLNTLLESKSKHERNRRGAVASMAFHAAVILVAVYATASGTQPSVQSDPPETLHWLPTPPPKSSTPAPATPRTQPGGLPHTTVVPIDVPTTLPRVDPAAAPITATDFGPVPSSGADSSLIAAPRDRGGRAYEASEVEMPVTAFGGVAPEYPAPLRSAGIEGKVSAEFVVNERGRAEVSSLRIVSSNNDLFSDAVRRALPRMRFNPARIGNHNVPQLVRQEFSFVLDR